MAVVKLTFDLSALLKEVEPDRRKRIAITPFLNNDSLKREFGKQAIDFILARTNDGKDVNNKAFTGYSTAYKKSLAFKVYRKTNKVNLNLTGAMQSDIDVIKISGTNVTIGFVNDDEDAKALGHINGAGDLPIRDFWGIKLNDQYSILKGLVKDIAASITEAELIQESTPRGQSIRSDGTEFNIDLGFEEDQ